MEDYNKNLILKYQNNLLSSLGMKYDEALSKYLFTHTKKGEDVEPVDEEKAFSDLLGFLKSYLRDKKCIIFVHSKGTFLDLFLLKLKKFNLSVEFANKIDGFCDFTTFMSQLKLDLVCKSARFQDIQDVYRQIIGNFPVMHVCFTVISLNV